MPCKVYLADDVEGIRALWRLFLESEPDVEVVGEAADGAAALAGVQATRPDVLVLDLSMPERDGLELIPIVRRVSPATAIVVASGFSASRMADLAAQMGATAYFEKGDPAPVLIRMIKDACSTPHDAG